ncbi:hypothetical protein BDU57DRAFT_516620 [Ampelomyces quisqualis]|uniref:Ig-like domain-containing protein n=1 Tax=Ampelomyces quisqualis TaxID=50730 RepID=A0A6A5QM23_AMPQU|nr:hypothetical protein BDU57DRAFT_516620 [Ampelomyces quisqualis]
MAKLGEEEDLQNCCILLLAFGKVLRISRCSEEVPIGMHPTPLPPLLSGPSSSCWPFVAVYRQQGKGKSTTTMDPLSCQSSGILPTLPYSCSQTVLVAWLRLSTPK